MPWQDHEEWLEHIRAEDAKRAEEYRIHSQEAWAASLRAEEEKKAEEDRIRRAREENSSAERKRREQDEESARNQGSARRPESSTGSVKWVAVTCAIVLAVYGVCSVIFVILFFVLSARYAQ